jgi:hypothetical protein
MPMCVARLEPPTAKPGRETRPGFSLRGESILAATPRNPAARCVPSGRRESRSPPRPAPGCGCCGCLRRS